jgi:hypothetical protein
MSSDNLQPSAGKKQTALNPTGSSKTSIKGESTANAPIFLRVRLDFFVERGQRQRLLFRSLDLVAQHYIASSTAENLHND